MADQKISQLTAATTPLAGTEVLPIVQSGVTKQVSVANLTSGRSVAASEVVVTSSTDAYPILVNVTAGSTAGIEFKDPTTTNNPVIASRGNNLAVEAGGNEIFRFGSNNNITMNLGNLAVGTAAKGINFTANTPAAGMTSQLLNWYEEGTFTPSITSGATGVSYTTQSGHYTRLGNMVFFRLNLVMSAATANGSAFKVGGLPFTCGQSGGGSFAYDNGAWTGSASTNMPMVFVGAGGTEISFFQGSGAQVVGTDLVNIGTDNFYIVGQYMV